MAISRWRKILHGGYETDYTGPYELYMFWVYNLSSTFSDNGVIKRLPSIDENGKHQTNGLYSMRQGPTLGLACRGI
jgi:hypothetical protein